MVVKFAGCYHGHVDALLAAAGSGRGDLRPARHARRHRRRRAADTIVLPYNDLAAVEAAFAAHGDEIACVITEAAAGNMGVVPPEPGFNAGAAPGLHRAHGALLISDEVMTGFRCQPRRAGTASTAPSRAGAPDLFTFGKVMGGGFPAAAFGGRADVMALLAPDGPGLPGRHAVREPGRHRRRAGHAARLHRRGLRPPRPRSRGHRRRAVADGAGRGRRAARRPARPGTHVLASSSRDGDRCRDYDDAQRAGRAGASRAFFHAMLDRGRLPAAERVRGVVRLRRARRRAPCDRVARRAARGGRAAAAGRSDRRRRPRDDRRPTHRRPPAAPRRGAQPRGRPLRPAARLPPLRARPADGRAGRRARSPDRDITHVVSSPLERAQETAAPIAAALGLDDRHRRAA